MTHFGLIWGGGYRIKSLLRRLGAAVFLLFGSSCGLLGPLGLLDEQNRSADGDSGDKILKMNHFGYITCTNSGFDVTPERMESDIRQFLSTPVSKCNEIVA